MSDKWEVVVKGGKHKQKSQLSTKEIKLMKENNLNGNRFIRRLDEETDESISPELIKIPSKNKIMPKAVSKPDNNNNLSQQINKISAESIKMLHKNLTEKFPTQPTVVLMDLALHLNLLLKTNDETMKTISFDNLDFPYGLLSTETKSALRNVFNGLSNTQLGSFLKSAMIQIIDDNERSLKSVGLMMLVQVCLKMKPTALIANRKSMFELVNMNREHPVKFKCLLWSLKQACVNFNVACQIWLIYVLPFISQRCHTETALSFGEEMLNYPTDIGGNDSALLATDFLPIVDLVFNQTMVESAETVGVKKTKKKTMNFLLTPVHVDRLSHIYRKIKEQIFSSKATSGTLKDFFASFFLRLSAKNNNEHLNTELLDCLDRCLTSCADTVKQLDHLYVGYPHQTKVFLDHFSACKSPAATIVMKQKSSKTVLDKMHSTATMSAAQDKVTKTTIATKSRKGSTKSGHCCATLLKVLLYTAVLSALTAWVVSSRYPQQYNTMTTLARPYYEYYRSRAMEGYAAMEPHGVKVLEQVRHKTRDLWAIAEPMVDKALMRVEWAGQYLYGRVNELAPSVVATVVDVVLVAEKYGRDSYEAARQWLRSNQWEDTMQSLVEQVRLGYKNAVTFVMKMVG